MLRSERNPKDVICRFWIASENTPLKGNFKKYIYINMCNKCYLYKNSAELLINYTMHQINAKLRLNKHRKLRRFHYKTVLL